MIIKCLQASLVVASLLATTAAPTFAETAPPKREEPRRDRDEGFPWGLLGLLGLGGLAGLRGRSRDDSDLRRDNDIRRNRVP